MIDWNSSMAQTYEFYEVDPNTWKDKRPIRTILSCTIKRDADSDTLETASFETTEQFGECYIRIYLIATQKRVRYKFPLGTFLVQTPSTSYDGTVHKITMDAYSPLLELKDKKPDLGYTVMKNANIMQRVSVLTKDNIRVPVVEPSNVNKTLYEDFTAEADESWLSYLIALMENAEYKYCLDEISRVLFSPDQDVASLQPRHTYNDDNSSILYPEIKDSYDLYGIPNVVEVLYTGSDSNTFLFSRVVNDDPNSPTSTVTRGREVVHRETSPSISGTPNQEYMDEYAKTLLKNLSSVEHTISYSHGYCSVRVGDCVRLNYEKAGISNTKAKVVSQDIKCTSGCVVNETAVYTTNLWKDD